ncbi:hypothetical protein LZZ85_23240 [Terrimonas sp. NA20]|uniref:Uncharacterized protein n=1 Tax=Terrimonas ginsenosidimutans TaxID=2908004 RepID=A0ABS9KY28_9BACT|nr:hypothetical protein [Terrimonas ginsenosidimutans]MCG2617230.1 hypothetical protein [Terrimonas ginsenosidimutans]
MNRFVLTAFAAACMFSSCKNEEKKPEPAKGATPVSGQWIIIYPKDILVSDDQKVVYAAAQDSIVNLFGLKLISFGDDGRFVQADSSQAQPGTWLQKNNGEILIDHGGLGFDNFRGDLVGVDIKTMKISQDLKIEDQTIPVEWHLKRLNVDQAKALLGAKENWWRKKAPVPESDSAIKVRIRSMLEYYSAYFTLVSEESSYFSMERVMLPFNYYQHAVGLKSYKKTSPAFLNVFYNESDAQRAYKILESGMIKRAKLKDYPSGKDYVIEYAMYMKKLAEAL